MPKVLREYVRKNYVSRITRNLPDEIEKTQKSMRTTLLGWQEATAEHVGQRDAD